MTKQEDALASAVAELRAAAEPERVRRDTKRAAEIDRRAKERAAWEARCERFLAVARPADAWYADWIERGRLALLLGARPDEQRRSIDLPELWMRKQELVWEHEHPRPALQDPWPVFGISLGKTIHIRVTGPSTRAGRPGGSVARLRRVIDLADVAGRKRPFGWPGIAEQILDAGTRLAELLCDDALEPLLARRAREAAEGLRKLVAIDTEVRALARRERGARARLVERLIDAGRLKRSARTTAMAKNQVAHAIEIAIANLRYREEAEDAESDR